MHHLQRAEVIKSSQFLEFDVNTKKNLELVETLRNRERQYSLLWLLDKCKTAAGSRMLKRWISNPLCNSKAIEDRLKIVDSFDEIRNENKASSVLLYSNSFKKAIV